MKKFLSVIVGLFCALALSAQPSIPINPWSFGLLQQNSQSGAQAYIGASGGPGGGSTNLATGGTGIAIPNLVSPNQTYVLDPSGDAWGSFYTNSIRLTNGVTYFVHMSDNALNADGLTDAGGAFILTQLDSVSDWGAFTPGSTGQFFFTSLTSGSPVNDYYVCVSNLWTRPVGVNLLNPLPVSMGGTGTSDVSGFPNLFGVQNIGSFSVGMWTVSGSVTPSYVGQPVVGFGGGFNQPANLAIASATSAGSITNGLTLPYGVNIIGNPSYMSPGRFNFLEIFTAGNPIDQTNIFLDQGARLWTTDPHSSGAAWTCAWTGTNSIYGSAAPWAGWPTGSITNKAGEISFVHDSVADAFMCVPDGAAEADSPNQSIWVCNAFAHMGDASVHPMQALMVNQPGGSLTPGNYPALTVNSPAASLDLGWFQDQAWGCYSNNYKFSLRAKLFTGEIDVPNTLNASNIVVTNSLTVNGNASFASNVVAGHFSGVVNAATPVPTVAALTATMGTGATATLDATASDAAMYVTINSATVSGQVMFTVTFGRVYAAVPHVVFVPFNLAAANLVRTEGALVTSLSTSAFSLSTASGNPASSSTYIFEMIVVQ